MNNQNSKHLHILISGRIYEQKQITELTNKVIQTFLNLTQTYFYFIDDKTRRKISQRNSALTCNLFNRALNQKMIDYIVTIGGDGTILYAAKQFFGVSPPLLTFHQGTLGFLCKFKIEQLESTIQKAVQVKLNKIINKKDLPFEVCTLMRLQSSLKTKKDGKYELVEKKIVLNQVSITRQNHNRIILQISINNEYITTTAGDGILISTPTGSTAYALSAGGPIVLNGVNSIILVPIAPNSLSFRPICLPSNAVIHIKVSSKSRSNALVTFDGQSNIQLTQHDVIQIRHQIGQASNDLILYEPKLADNQQSSMPSWMQRLKHFLGWNQIFKSPSCSALNKQIDTIQIPECNQNKSNFDHNHNHHSSSTE